MDLAQACERLWFLIFDPALTVSTPPPPLLLHSAQFLVGSRAFARYILIKCLRAKIPCVPGEHAALPAVLHRRGARAVARALWNGAVPVDAAHSPALGRVRADGSTGLDAAAARLEVCWWAQPLHGGRLHARRPLK